MTSAPSITVHLDQDKRHHYRSLMSNKDVLFSLQLTMRRELYHPGVKLRVVALCIFHMSF